jgi:hypothetical protein
VKLKDKNRYSLAHFAVLLASDRYMEKSKDIIGLNPDDDAERSNILEVMSYLSGLLDMACLYIGVANDDEVATHLKHIDAKIEGILDGTYGREEEGDGDSDERDVR